jgi:hypothetical protein
MLLQSSNSGYEETISLYSLLPFKELLSLVKKNRVKESSDYVVYIPESETQTINIDEEDIYLIPSMLWGTQKTLNLEGLALYEIAKKFRRVKEVKSIYVQKYGEELQIFVLVSVEKYDDDLMDKLLDMEYDIRKRFPELVFEFFYPPANVSEKKDFIHPQAECIFSR